MYTSPTVAVFRFFLLQSTVDSFAYFLLSLLHLLILSFYLLFPPSQKAGGDLDEIPFDFGDL